MSLLRFAALVSVLVVVFLLTLVTDAHCQEAKPSTAFRLTGVAMAGLGAADVAMTTTCVRAGRCYETNPIFKSQAHNALVLGAAKAAVVTGTWALSSSLRKRGHRKAGWAVLLGVTAVQGVTVAWNANQLRKVRR